MADAIVILMVGYAALGAAFAVYFVARGAGAIELRAGAAPLIARLLWAPGAMALWPVLAVRCARAERRGTGGR
jgi:hypothetical protein